MQAFPSSTSSLINCSFCKQHDNESHKCRSEIFGLLNRLAQENKENAFSEIENLVFQGGGVKGIAYVGVLRKLFDEYNLHEQVKRVAGSSAGAIAALYVSLGLDTPTIAGLMKEKLLDKLEDGPAVEVEGVPFEIRKILEKALKLYENHTKEEVINLVSKVTGDLLSSVFGWKGSVASFFGSSPFANFVADLVFLSPNPEDHKTISDRVADLEQEIIKEEKVNDPQPPKDENLSYIKGIRLTTKLPFYRPITLEDKNIFEKALSELIRQTFIAEKPRFPDGWFPGDKVKADLIIAPIRKAFENLHLPVPNIEDFTFEDLANVTVEGKPAFKKLYVTAFNSITRRTEVFSVDHTPNVLVVDAVRASMSIPVFFKPVTIQQRVNGVNEPRRIYVTESSPTKITYMDGGILDNYPMWIFDDLQYCMSDSIAQDWKPKQKILIRNPFTLGIKLMDNENRLQILNPYIDKERLLQKAIKLPKEVNAISLLTSYFFAQAEENQHINRGDTSRTIYVDNLGVTAVSFSLEEDDIKNMYKAGELAVRQYLNYARWNKLSSIGENYYSVRRSLTSSLVERRVNNIQENIEEYSDERRQAVELKSS